MSLTTTTTTAVSATTNGNNKNNIYHHDDLLLLLFHNYSSDFCCTRFDSLRCYNCLDTNIDRLQCAEPQCPRNRHSFFRKILSICYFTRTFHFVVRFTEQKFYLLTVFIVCQNYQDSFIKKFRNFVHGAVKSVRKHI